MARCVATRIKGALSGSRRLRAHRAGSMTEALLVEGALIAWTTSVAEAAAEAASFVAVLATTFVASPGMSGVGVVLLEDSTGTSTGGAEAGGSETSVAAA